MPDTPDDAASRRRNGRLTTAGLSAEKAAVTLEGGAWTISSGVTTVERFDMDKYGTVLTGAGDLNVSGAFEWLRGAMRGAGTTTVQAGVTGTVGGELERSFVNEGTLTLPSEELYMGKHALFTNEGTFIANCLANGHGSDRLHGYHGRPDWI